MTDPTSRHILDKRLIDALERGWVWVLKNGEARKACVAFISRRSVILCAKDKEGKFHTKSMRLDEYGSLWALKKGEFIY